MASRKLIVEIIGDSRSLEKSFGRIESRSEKFNRRLRTSAKAGLVGAVVGGTAIAVTQLKASVEAAKDSEKATFRLRDAFKSAGATQKQFAATQRTISKVSKEAALDDEDLSDSVAHLTRTTGSARKGLKGMALAANIARARNISLAAATKIVEKAHVGQLRGLKGVGVEIDKNTTGTEALERAQKKFRGAGQEFGKTAAASQERLGVAFENLQEKIGTKLLPTLQRGAIKLTQFIEGVEKNWPRINEVIQDTITVLRPIVVGITKQVKGIANVIAGVVRTVKAIANGDWAEAWRGIKQIALDGLLEIVKGVTHLPIMILRALGTGAFNQLKRIGTSIKEAALDGLRGLGNAIVSVVQGAINRMIRVVNAAIGKINKVLPLKDIPDIPELGAARNRTVNTRPPVTSKNAQPINITTTVNLDGQTIARVTRPYNERDKRSNPSQKRGGNWRR